MFWFLKNNRALQNIKLLILLIKKIIYKRKINKMANKKSKPEKYIKNLKSTKKAYKQMEKNLQILKSLSEC